MQPPARVVAVTGVVAILGVAVAKRQSTRRLAYPVPSAAEPGGRFRASRLDPLVILAVAGLAVRAFAHGFDVLARAVNRVACRKEQPA